MKKFVISLSTLAVAALLIVAPTAASARPIDAPGLPHLPASNSAPTVTLDQNSTPNGFDWGDAAIGAGTVSGVIAFGLGGAIGARRLRANAMRHRMPAATSS